MSVSYASVERIVFKRNEPIPAVRIENGYSIYVLFLFVVGTDKYDRLANPIYYYYKI